MRDDVLDRNLSALLTRALPDDAPSESFRRRVALTVATRLSAAVPRPLAEAPPSHVPGGAAATSPRATRPAVRFGGPVAAVIGALAAAAVLVLVFRGALDDDGSRRPSEGPRATPGGAHGPWIALGSGRGPLASEALLGALVSNLTHASAPAGLSWSVFPAGAAAFAAQVAASTAHAHAGVGPAGERPTAAGAPLRVPVGAAGSVSPAELGPAAAADLPATPAEAPADVPAGPGAPRLWVQVVAAEGGAPVAHFRAWVKREVFVPQVAEPTLTEVAGLTGVVALTASGQSSHTLVIEADGYAPWRTTGLRAGDADKPVVVALQRGVPLVGSVFDATTSAPVAGALVFVESALPRDVVEVHARDLEPLPLHAVTTDAAGAFRIERAPRGEVVLRASHPDFAPAWSVTLDLAATPLEAPGAVQVPPIALELGGVVIGRVERADGSPFEGAEIVLSTLAKHQFLGGSGAPGAAPAHVMTYGAATTDRDGSYHIEHLPAGHFVALNMGDVAAGAPLPRMRQTLVGVGETTRVDFLVDGARSVGGGTGAPGALRATERAALVGRLRDADHAPCVAVDLSLYELQTGAWRAARTDSVGRFEFQGVTPGSWAICRATRGYEHQQVLHLVDVSLDRRSPLELDITLPRGALTLAVQHDDGRPVTSGRLTLQREVASGELEFHAVLALHESGRTRVDALPDGRYRATVIGDTPGLGHVQLGLFAVHGENEVRERCTLPRGGALVLNVRDEHGSPAPAYVLVTDAAGEELLLDLDPSTDAGGVRHIPCLAPGSYTLHVHTLEGLRRSVPCEVHEGQTSELTVALTPR